jgi:PPK2 family polyphosphate:nucleotide phosphotransferase
MLKRYLLKPGTKVDLRKWNPSAADEFKGGKDEAAPVLQSLIEELVALQEKLYAEQKQRILVVLQAMDTGGKDGVVRHVFGGVNPQGVRVASFKVPTPPELAHDYLWRVHAQTPGKGEIVIFNRSHYEDVLAVRVHNIVPEDVWSRRFDQINAFEKTLAEEGTTILKFFLHISPSEQKQRLLDRLKDDTKQWKFNPGDLKERALWKDYMQAYEDVLNKTSSEYAPWYLIPADKKWYRDLVIASILVDTLKQLKIDYPHPGFDVAAMLKELEASPDNV